MRKTITTTLLSAAGLLATAAHAATTLTYSSWLPWTHPINVELYIPWMEDIEKESNGSIKFKRLPKAVASPPAHLSAIRTGQADVAMSVHEYTSKTLSPYLFSGLPMLGDTAVATSMALQSTHDKFLTGKGFYKGVHVVGMNTHGPGLFHHRSKHILKPSDMEGQKFRTGGPIPLKIVEAWGGVSIRQPAPKSYEILSTGVADGITFPYESLTSFKITRLVPFSTYIPGGLYSSSHYLMINAKKYAKLSPEDKAIIDKHSGIAFAERGGKAWDLINDRGLAEAKAAGNNIVTAPDSLVQEVRKLNVQFEADYIAGANEAGVDGAEILKFFHSEVARLSGK